MTEVLSIVGIFTDIGLMIILITMSYFMYQGIRSLKNDVNYEENIFN